MHGVFQLGSNDPYIKLIQRALNEKTQFHLARDGSFGPMVQSALKAWQTVQQMTPDGIYANQTATILDAYIASRFLQDADFVTAAQMIGCEVAAIKAVKTVETSGEGFLPTAQTTILFERHKFKQQFDAKLSADSGFTQWMHDYLNLPAQMGIAPLAQVEAALLQTYSDIYNPVPGGYSSPSDEYPRLNKAATLDKVSAQAACSWGLFQVMGYNFAQAGFDSVQDMVLAYSQSEQNQLQSFCKFILKDSNLTAALRTKNWASFALHYNGPNYAQSNPPYDVRLENAYDQFS